MDQSTSIRWGGDFSLPRFRAKLANKYLLHPDVEPEYQELYRPELGERTIVKRDLENYGMTSTFSDFGRTRSGGFNNTALPLDATMMPRSSSSVFAESRRGLADTGRSLASTTGSIPTLSSSSSAPLLGLRRSMVGPARPPQVVKETPPPASSDDRKEWEKEKAIEAASKKLWVASNGAEFIMKKEFGALAAASPDKTVPWAAISKISCGGIQRALKMGARVDWRNDEWDGATLLIKVVRQGAKELMLYLLAIGADPTICDKSGRNVLHWAAIEGRIPILTELLGRIPAEMSLDEGDGGGDTPIHLAAFYGHLPVTRLLVRAQADPNQRNAGGHSALELAEARRNWAVAQYLNEYRQQQADADNGREGEGELEINDFLRASDQIRVRELRLLAAEQPKGKKK